MVVGLEVVRLEMVKLEVMGLEENGQEQGCCNVRAHPIHHTQVNTLQGGMWGKLRV